MLFAAPPLSPVMPEDELISPFGTPATERAVRIAREGLAAAEVLDASGMVLPAAEMKAATLEAAADAYRKRRHKGLRSPLRAVSAANGAIPRPPTPSPPSAVMVAAAAAPAYSAPWGAQLVEAEGQEWARRLSPSDIQAVIISGASLVRDTLAEGHRPFTLYQLHIPLRHSEHMAFRRYSDFVTLDVTLRRALAEQQWSSAAPTLLALGDLSCLTLRGLPALPPKTLPLLQDPTSSGVVAMRWGQLQRYLDAALDRVSDCPAAFAAFAEFLCLDGELPL